MKAPEFWQDSQAPLGRMLAPLGWLYAETTAWRLAHAHRWRAPVPVVCVGNLTAGGVGKTPVVRDFTIRLSARGLQPHILSRGYGGRESGPVRVDPEKHDAASVGDEPLLLARDAPCWVSANRAQGAHAIAAAGGRLIVMDDGLQNPSLVQDLRLIVADGETGFGNGRPIPAGPLRERVATGLARADALAIIGTDTSGLAAAVGARLPVLRGRIETRDGAWLAGARVVGFAGIGRPEKFHATLARAGAEIRDFRRFADHHHYREGELALLARDAERANSILVTTEKDWVRLTSRWRARIRPVAVAVRWEDEAFVEALLNRIPARV